VIKRLFCSLTVAALMAAYTPGTFAQQPQPQQAPAQAERTFEGELVKVDAKAQTLSVKGASGAMTFSYTDQTKVDGPEKTVAGLATKSGTPLRITYRSQGDMNVATRIEVAEKK
jgi:hypothetical protein